MEEPGPFLWIITNVSSSCGERSPRPSCDVVCYVLSTVTHRWSRWTPVSFFSFEARVSHDAPGSFWTRWTCRTGFSRLPTGSLKLHASNWKWKKTIRTSNSFPYLYLNRLWSNWTCCKFFPFHFSTTNFNFLQGAMWSCSGLGLHGNFILANVWVVLLWYCYCIVFTTIIITFSPSSPGAPGRPTSPWGNTETELSSNWTLFQMPLCWPVTTGQHLVPAGLL